MPGVTEISGEKLIGLQAINYMRVPWDKHRSSISYDVDLDLEDYDKMPLDFPKPLRKLSVRTFDRFETLESLETFHSMFSAIGVSLKGAIERSCSSQRGACLLIRVFQDFDNSLTSVISTEM